MNERDIESFWDKNPCGEQLVGGLSADHEEFFARYDAYRYQKEAHLLECLDRVDWAGKDVLEVGLGQGADAEQIVRRGGRWSGLDLTKEAVARTAMRMKLRGLDHGVIRQGSILRCPFEDDSFDLVFSHGVLHHVPDVRAASGELHRVLRPGGELVVMVYARWSLNYLVSISILRRLGLIGMRAAGVSGRGLFAAHVARSKEEGLLEYLKMGNFIHRNSDGPDNPYSKVYDRASLATDFAEFEVTRTYKRFMHAPPLPVTNWPGGRWMGWHLWAHLKPR